MRRHRHASADPVSPLFATLPPPLRHGDRVRLVAASSALDQGHNLEAGITVLRDWGLQVEARSAEILRRRWGYLAGRDHERSSDLHHTPCGTAEPAPALYACVRGGWGSARLLESSPDPPSGWLLGFSDVTSLLWDRLARGRGGGIHGPLLTTLAAEPGWSQERLRRLLFGGDVEDLVGVGWGGGVAVGPLLVANLTVATHLLGTPHLPSLEGAILILLPAQWPRRRVDAWSTLLRARAAENQLYMAGCNRVGRERAGTGGDTPFGGHSAVIDPWGNVVIEGGESELLLTATIDMDRVAEVRAHMPVFRDRRPDLYGTGW